MVRDVHILSGYVDAFSVLKDHFHYITDSIYHNWDAALAPVHPAGCAPHSMGAAVVIVSGPIPFPRHNLTALVAVSNHNSPLAAHQVPDSTVQCLLLHDWLQSMRIDGVVGYPLSTRHKTQRFSQDVVGFL